MEEIKFGIKLEKIMNDIKENEMIICKDIKSDGAKKYGKTDNIDKYIKLLETNENYYEYILKERKVRPYFDLEIEYTEENKIMTNIEKFKKILIETMNEMLKIKKIIISCDSEWRDIF